MSSLATTQVVTYQLAGVSAPMTGAFLATGSPFTSDAIDVRNSDGFASIVIDVDAVGTEDVTYAYQVSVDGDNWFTPYDNAASSVATIKANAAVADAGVYAVDIQLATHIRFVLTIATNSTINSFKFMQKESR